MSEPIKVKIGGKDYEVPKLKYKQLKAIWPRMKGTLAKLQAAKGANDANGGTPNADSVTGTFDAVDDAIFVISQALMRNNAEHTAEWIESEMEPSEAIGMVNCIWELMTATGLIKPGKLDQAALDQVLQSGIGTNTSPS